MISKSWDQIKHAKKWLLFSKNIGKRISIDETSLSNGELYTILTNKAVKGKKGTIVAMVAGTKAETVIVIIEKTLLNNETWSGKSPLIWQEIWDSLPRNVYAYFQHSTGFGIE